MNSYCDEDDVIRILRKAYNDSHNNLTEIIQLMATEFSVLLDITDKNKSKFIGKIMNNEGNKPFNHEIEAQRDKADQEYNVIYYEPGSVRHKARILGIREALNWVLGDIEYPPMEK